MLSRWISIGICDSSSMMVNFIMIALCSECKFSNHLPQPIIIGLKVFAFVDMAEVLRQSIATTSNN
jgi:hypothetical protein